MAHDFLGNIMYFDLNVPVQVFATSLKPQKGPHVYTPPQIAVLEARIDLLVHLGYTVLAFNQTAHKRVDPKTHANLVDSLISQLKKRPGIIYLKRLTIVLDEDSEKGFGMTNANIALFTPTYDLISLLPTTLATFSLACLTHTLPSQTTAHIISLPLTSPRMGFHMKHTCIKAALRNGAVFEIPYAGALGSDGGDSGAGSGSDDSVAVKRNWWAATRELVRVTKGKGIIVTGGVTRDVDLRAPRDIGNLITMLGLPQDVAHDASTKIPKAVTLRAQTRKTYRAVLSEPTLIIPPLTPSELPPGSSPHLEATSATIHASTPTSQKRMREDEAEDGVLGGPPSIPASGSGGGLGDAESGARKKKKRKKAGEKGA